MKWNFIRVTLTWHLLTVFVLSISFSVVITSISKSIDAQNVTHASCTTEKLNETKTNIEYLNENGSQSTVTQQPINYLPISTTKGTVRVSSNFCKCGVMSFGSGKIVGGTPVSKQNFWPWFATLV